MLKMGFIGFGNIASALAKGILRKRNDIEMSACAAHFDALKERTSPLGITAYSSIDEVIESSDIVVIAIKPYQIKKALEGKAELFKDKVILSLAAGWLNSDYEELLPGTHHISAIPNTPIEVCMGVTTVENVNTLSEDELTAVRMILETVGTYEECDSAHLAIANTLSGCGPAYAAMFVEALGDAGVKHGLTRKQAYRLAAAMIAGSGQLMLEKDLHPGVAKDQVCSPGGLTIKGVCSLEESGFRGAVIKAIDEVVRK